MSHPNFKTVGHAARPGSMPFGYAAQEPLSSLDMARRRVLHPGGHRAEIRALGGLPSEIEITENLQKIARTYGNVLSISPLPATLQEREDQSLFLVNFEKTADALAASRDLKCYLFGFSQLVVPVPRINPVNLSC